MCSISTISHFHILTNVKIKMLGILRDFPVNAQHICLLLFVENNLPHKAQEHLHKNPEVLPILCLFVSRAP